MPTGVPMAPASTVAEADAASSAAAAATTTTPRFSAEAFNGTMQRILANLSGFSYTDRTGVIQTIAAVNGKFAESEMQRFENDTKVELAELEGRHCELRHAHELKLAAVDAQKHGEECATRRKEAEEARWKAEIELQRAKVELERARLERPPVTSVAVGPDGAGDSPAAKRRRRCGPVPPESLIAWFTADGADRHVWYGCVPLTHRLWRSHAGSSAAAAVHPVAFVNLVFRIVTERWVVRPDHVPHFTVVYPSLPGVRMRYMRGPDDEILTFVYATEAFLAVHPEKAAILEDGIRMALSCAA